jgi:hypothetical protein
MAQKNGPSRRFGRSARVIFDALAEIILPKTSREISICACTENGDADGTTDQGYGDVASVALGEDQAAAKRLKSLRTISRN